MPVFSACARSPEPVSWPKPWGRLQACETVNSPRTLLFRLLLSSLTGAVLLAIGALCPDLRVHDPQPSGTAEITSQTSGLGDRDTSERRTVLAATADLDVDDEEQPRVASLESYDLAGERLAIVASVLAVYCRVPLSHPPCASRPTGPPHD